jgi:outer membrane protein
VQRTGEEGSVTQANSRWVFQQQVQATQYIYKGGRTVAATAQAENAVRGERARLLAEEEQEFSNGVSAYVTVIEDQQLYELQVSNVQVLTKQLEATNARFSVGEITRTDVAQAQAALEQAIAERETAYGTLQTARATYRQVIGDLPDKLIEPQPLALPVKNAEEADTLAAENNATLIAAEYDDAASKDAVDAAYAAVMPQVSVQASAFYNNQAANRQAIQRGGIVGGNITMPIYQGGSEYAAIRQAKQNEQQSRKSVDDSRRTAVQQATQFWETYVAAKATVVATRAEIRADEIALDGVEREALAGTQTTLDVLNAEQALLSARVTLVQNLASLVNDSYSLAGAIGRLTARDLGLNVPLYDETAYYNDVRDLPFGTNDHATNQPGR